MTRDMKLPKLTMQQLLNEYHEPEHQRTMKVWFAEAGDEEMVALICEFTNHIASLNRTEGLHGSWPFKQFEDEEKALLELGLESGHELVGHGKLIEPSEVASVVLLFRDTPRRYRVALWTEMLRSATTKGPDKSATKRITQAMAISIHDGMKEALCQVYSVRSGPRGVGMPPQPPENGVFENWSFFDAYRGRETIGIIEPGSVR